MEFVPAAVTVKICSLKLFQKARKPLELHRNGSLKATDFMYRERNPQEAEASAGDNGSDHRIIES